MPHQGDRGDPPERDATAGARTATGAIDWPRAYERLARAEAALAAAATRSPDDVRRILRDRAVRLARPEATTDALQTLDLVVFRSGGGRYAVESGQASAAIPAVPTPLPGVPPFHLGLIMHRGTVCVLVDVGPLLGRARTDRANSAYAILCAVGDDIIAIAADAIDGLMRLDARTIAHSAEGGNTQAAIRGVTPDEVVIIDAGRLLRDARLTVDDQPPIYGTKTGRQEP